MTITKTIAIAAAFLASFILGGCAKTTNAPANNSAPANSATTNSSGPAKATDSTTPTPANTATGDNSDAEKTIYTDITAKKCKTTDSNEEEQWIVQLCDGVGGYKLEVTEADIRQTVNVVAPNGKKSELNFQANVDFGFSALGEKAEWRVEKKDGKPVPYAMIVRLNANNADNPDKNTSYLVVSKIGPDKSCITDVVKPMAKQNEEARKLADAAPSRPCKTQNE